MQADNLSVEETGRGGGLFIVTGTGTLTWSAARIVVEEQRIIANGVEVSSRPDNYRNLVIEKDGCVRPDAFLPFERRFPLP